MDALVQFLRDRYNEERADALKRAGVFPTPVVWDNGDVALHVYPTGTAVVLRGPSPDGYDDLAALKTWADTEGGWTQARVLAEVDAKRQVLDRYENQAVLLANHMGGILTKHLVQELRAVVQLLGLPYASHLDYQPAWAPDPA